MAFLLQTEDVRFGANGLYTDTIGAKNDNFDKFFSGNHRLALFIDETARNGDFTDNRELQSNSPRFLFINFLATQEILIISASSVPISIVVVFCNNPDQPVCGKFEAIAVNLDDDEPPQVAGELLPIMSSALVIAGVSTIVNINDSNCSRTCRCWSVSGKVQS